MQRLFVISGSVGWCKYERSCMFYEKQSEKWTSTSYMMEGRANAACTVFEGKLVVSGGSREEYIKPKAGYWRYKDTAL